jgi:hypothetical protein
VTTLVDALQSADSADRRRAGADAGMHDQHSLDLTVPRVPGDRRITQLDAGLLGRLAMPPQRCLNVARTVGDDRPKYPPTGSRASRNLALDSSS